MWRKRISHLLIWSLGLSLLGIAATAFASASLDVDANVAPDGSTTATVSLDGNMTVAGVQFALTYDPNVLTLVSSQSGALGGSYTVNDAESGKVSVVWYDVNGESVRGKTNVLTLSFAPRGTGETAIGFDDAMHTMVVDNSLAAVATTTNPATVTIQSGVPSATASIGSDTPYATPYPVPAETAAIPTAAPLPESSIVPEIAAATAAPVTASGMDNDAPPAPAKPYDAPPAEPPAELAAQVVAADVAPSPSAGVPSAAAPVAAADAPAQLAVSAASQIEVMASENARPRSRVLLPAGIGAAICILAAALLLYKRRQR